MVRSAVLRVRIEPGIPKLLVKINPADAESFSAKNLGEVTLRKGVASRSQVAVLHMSRGTAQGEVLMSVKLADLLDLEDGEGVEVASALSVASGTPGSAAAPSNGDAAAAAAAAVRGRAAAAAASAAAAAAAAASGSAPSREPPSRFQSSPAWGSSETPPPKLQFSSRAAFDPGEWLRNLEREQSDAKSRHDSSGGSSFQSEWLGTSRGPASGSSAWSAMDTSRVESWPEGSLGARIGDYRSHAGFATHRPSSSPQTSSMPPSTPEWLRGLHSGLRNGQDSQSAPSDVGARRSSEADTSRDASKSPMAAGDPSGASQQKLRSKAAAAAYQRNGSMSSFLETYGPGSSSRVMPSGPDKSQSHRPGQEDGEGSQMHSSAGRQAMQGERQFASLLGKDSSRPSMRYVQSARGLRERTTPSPSARPAARLAEEERSRFEERASGFQSERGSQGEQGLYGRQQQGLRSEVASGLASGRAALQELLEGLSGAGQVDESLRPEPSAPPLQERARAFTDPFVSVGRDAGGGGSSSSSAYSAGSTGGREGGSTPAFSGFPSAFSSRAHQAPQESRRSRIDPEQQPFHQSSFKSSNYHLEPNNGLRQSQSQQSQQSQPLHRQQLHQQQHNVQNPSAASPPERDAAPQNWRDDFAPKSCQQAAAFSPLGSSRTERTSTRRHSGSGFLDRDLTQPLVRSQSPCGSSSRSHSPSSKRDSRTQRLSRGREPAQAFADDHSKGEPAFVAQKIAACKSDATAGGFAVDSGASSRAASTPSSPPESSPSEGESGGSTASNLSGPNSSVSSGAAKTADASVEPELQTEANTWKKASEYRTRASSVSLPLAIVPVSASCAKTPGGANSTPGSTGGSSRRRDSLDRMLRRRRTSTLGALQPELPEQAVRDESRSKVPEQWLPPVSDDCGGSLERSELGPEATVEVRRWLIGETSGPQCSQVILDRALTVLSNFKLASGCQLEVLGGPLGAIVGGYSDSDWLLDEVFHKHPADAISEAFTLLGFRPRSSGDWSAIAVEDVSLVYRRMCLRGHPSRGGSPREYLKLQVAMELVKAFCGEAGPLQSSQPAPCSPCKSPTASGADVSAKSGATESQFVLSDLALARELQLTSTEAEAEASQLLPEQLEEMNRALDEYILRQMCFKSEIVDEIARLHEDSAYAILGVSSSATEAEIKKAYRLIAMQCHPDKGGDKEEFQELTNAYEKIMEQRRSADDKGCKDGRDGGSDEEAPTPVPKQNKRRHSKESSKGGKKKDGTGSGEEDDSGTEDEDGAGDATAAGSKDAEDKDADADGAKDGEDQDTTTLLEKASKAAEEASRYAKTAAEFAHQAAEAAEAARKDQERGSRDALTKSVAHSAIVYTLTVVKAVRAVGYATLDVAAQCRAAAKCNPAATACGEQAVSAMSLGLEALNSALSCAEVTEITAAELQAPMKEDSPDKQAAAERFVGAAVRASLAAAGASNAAMAAAIAAVEGSRQCAKALEQKRRGNSAEAGDSDAGEGVEVEEEAAGEAEDGAAEADASEAERPSPQRSSAPTPEQAAAAATQRLIAQRNNNHKVLQRLNSEILSHQRNVREFLRQNRQLIPQVPAQSKQKIFRLLRDYATEAWTELHSQMSQDAAAADKFLASLGELSLLVPFLQPQSLAIPVSVKARILKMAALYDLPLAMRLLDEEIFSRARESLSALCEAESGPGLLQRLEELADKIRLELSSNVAEEEAVGGLTPGPGGQTPQGFGGAGQTPTAAEESQTSSGRFGSS